MGQNSLRGRPGRGAGTALARAWREAFRLAGGSGQTQRLRRGSSRFRRAALRGTPLLPDTPHGHHLPPLRAQAQMKILVIGGGGREHALAWKIVQSPKAEKVFVAPGNAGSAREAKCENVSIAAEDVDGLLRFAQQNKIDLTIVGPEAPLVLGVVDRFRAAGLRIFGPTKNAAQLEGSKAFAKDFLARHKIPTAAYANL